MKVFIKNNQSPGDIVMLTAAVRDLKLAHPDIEVGVKTAAGQIWENNPHINHTMKECDADRVIKAEYPLIQKSNQLPYHFIHGFRKDLEEKLNIKIPVTAFHGDIHLSDDEKGWMSQVEEIGHKEPFWIILAGGKYDFTAKWWNPHYYQRVVNKLSPEVKFVQCGSLDHWHPPLDNVINFLGKTDIRQFIRLVYHAQGVVCPVTFAMHLAAAVPMKEDKPKNRPCVVIAGGREPAQWEAYPHHRYLSTNGSLLCCDNGGCWKSRCEKVGDGDEKDENLCENPVQAFGVKIPKCMDMIKPDDVVRSVRQYFNGGAVKPIETRKGRSGVRNSGKTTMTADNEIVVYGVKRVGNHMLLDWIASQFSGDKFFLNDLCHKPVKKTLFNKTKSNALPSLQNRFNAEDMEHVNLFLHSNEDISPEVPSFHSGVESKNKVAIIMLRDFRNWSCSMQKMIKNHKLKKTMDFFCCVWCSLADIVLSGNDDYLFVNYDKFISSKEYRDEIAIKIGVDNRTDESMKNVPSYGWGSSFDRASYDGRANEMKTLSRWEECKNSDWFISLIEKNRRAMNLNDELFGESYG